MTDLYSSKTIRISNKILVIQEISYEFLAYSEALYNHLWRISCIGLKEFQKKVHPNVGVNDIFKMSAK